jgi:hypothetical protein
MARGSFTAAGGIARKGIGVLSVVSLAFWAIDWAGSEHNRPLNFWLLLGLGLALVSAVLWGLEQRAKSRATSPGETHHHHYAPYIASGAVVSFGAVPLGSSPVRSGPPDERVVEGSPDAYKIVNVWDLLEEVPGQPLSIINRTLRYVELRGPALVGLAGSVQFIEVTFGILNRDVESILWEFGAVASCSVR